MREDNESIRQFAPLLRRLLILVAVIVAVPMVLWTITAFMRTYVAPPKLPTFRPLAATASIAAPNTADIATPAPPPTATASATTTDAPGPALGDRLSSAEVTPPAAPRTVAANPSSGGAAASPWPAPPTARSASPWPTTSVATNAPDGMPGVAPAATSPPSLDSSDSGADLGAGTPLAGPIPLPHPRPRSFTMAQNGIPMPRPRPTAVASQDTHESSDGPLGWFGNLFRQNQQNQQNPENQ